MNGKRPKGCDQQGRFPEAADGYPDILIDDDEKGKHPSGNREMTRLEWLLWALAAGVTLAAIFWPLGA